MARADQSHVHSTEPMRGYSEDSCVCSCVRDQCWVNIEDAEYTDAEYTDILKS